MPIKRHGGTSRGASGWDREAGPEGSNKREVYMTSSLQKNTEKIIRKNFLLAALQVKQKLSRQHKRLFSFGSPFWPDLGLE